MIVRINANRICRSVVALQFASETPRKDSTYACHREGSAGDIVRRMCSAWRSALSNCVSASGGVIGLEWTGSDKDGNGDPGASRAACPLEVPIQLRAQARQARADGADRNSQYRRHLDIADVIDEQQLEHSLLLDR